MASPPAHAQCFSTSSGAQADTTSRMILVACALCDSVLLPGARADSEAWCVPKGRAVHEGRRLTRKVSNKGGRSLGLQRGCCGRLRAHFSLLRAHGRRRFTSLRQNPIFGLSMQGQVGCLATSFLQSFTPLGSRPSSGVALRVDKRANRTW